VNARKLHKLPTGIAIARKETEMNVSLYQAAAALNANARWQEVLSENLAASFIPGFKKQDVSFGEIQAGLMQTANGPGQVLTLPQVNTATNFRQGELKFTGDQTDLALEGSGFFAIQLPDGSEAYTRDGEFHLDSIGQLMTKNGMPVLSDAGPILIDLNNPEPMSVSASGEVAQGLDNKGRLRLVHFENPERLTPTNRGYFLALNSDLRFEEATDTTVSQQYLEHGNASSIEEMAQMITALRAYEANQKVIQAQDERMGRLITELGNPS
jgi:flagellar basal-body rod protein FlgF